VEEKASILVIYTGGTIGMFRDNETGVLKAVNFDELEKFIPDLDLFHFGIDSYSFDPIIDSSNMTPELWVKLAEVIEHNYESYDGFVILHGSDTMSYTASALSFMLENLNKPVIFTGSQLPLGMVRTDGRENFVTALEIAAARHQETPIVPEVALYFENQLFRANRTHKFNAENFEAFRSVNYPPLAEVGVNIKYFPQRIKKPNFKKLKVHKKLDTSINVLHLFPGIRREMVHAQFRLPQLKAVILETYGIGNAPTDKWFLEEVQQAIDSGLLVLNISQCRGGSIEMGKYETSSELRKTGILNGGDLTVEAALTKFMVSLALYTNPSEVASRMETNWRGEMGAHA
jgi:L-asparaginase